jgi:transposase InsO family protein
VATRTHAECPLRLLTIVDEYTRECLGIEVARTLRADDVLHRLAQLIVQHGRPRYIRSDNNGPELRRMPFGNGSNSTLFIDPGSPWENGYN